MKIFTLVFDDDELHTEVKSLSPRIGESMKQFIIRAIAERVKTVKKELAKKESEESNQ